jgi:hypothetical protein
MENTIIELTNNMCLNAALNKSFALSTISMILLPGNILR